MTCQVSGHRVYELNTRLADDLRIRKLHRLCVQNILQ